MKKIISEDITDESLKEQVCQDLLLAKYGLFQISKSFYPREYPIHVGISPMEYMEWEEFMKVIKRIEVLKK